MNNTGKIKPLYISITNAVRNIKDKDDDTHNITNIIHTLTVDVCIPPTVCDDSYKFNTDICPKWFINFFRYKYGKTETCLRKISGHLAQTANT